MQTKVLKNLLITHIHRISNFLQALPEAYLHQSPDNRWTIGEELSHLTKSNLGTARLLSQSPAQLRKAEKPSRSYEEVVQEYEEKYAQAKAPRGPQSTQPNRDTLVDKSTLEAEWNRASQALLDSLKNWQSESWGQYTVWKHPLLGVLTVQEMLYFTAYHNEHHAFVVEEKYKKLTSLV
ncbi:MAG: DinB family protein [Bacteroidota bacterium]